MYHAVQNHGGFSSLFKDTKVGYVGVFERGGYPKY